MMQMRSLGAWVRRIGLVLVLGVAWPAQAGLVVTVTATGTIAEGEDDGTLTGTSFSVTGGAPSLEVTMIQVFEEAAGSTLSPGIGDFSVASVSFSVGGGSAVQYLGGSGVYSIGPGSMSAFVTQLLGDLVSNVLVDSTSIGSSDLGQSIVLSSGAVGTSLFSFGASLLDSFFFAESGTVTISASNDVPEPATLMLSGMALVLFTCRRGRRPGGPG